MTNTLTMKKLLMAIVAVLTIAGCSVTDKNMAASQATGTGNVTEQLVALINDYTQKINAVESVYDLFFISEKCYKEKMSFEKNNAEEITTLKNTLTKEGQTALDEAVKSAMSEFEAAVNRKAKALAEGQEATNEKKSTK